MFQRRIPEWLRHAPTPGIRGFAILAGIESAARGFLTSVFPIVMYRTFGDAERVSEIYILIGIASFAAALMTPYLSRFVARRWLYTSGAALMLASGLGAAFGGPWPTAIGLAGHTVATVVVTVCFNAYVMDYIQRSTLGECETQRLFYSAAAWTIGPYLGIWLMNQWAPAPFVASAAAALVMMAAFWIMRLGNGKVIVRAKRPAANPLAYLPRFMEQPRLVAGWLFAVIRSCGWWVYVVYLPIFAVESGYSDQLGGLIVSVTNGFLFLAPLMLRWTRTANVRRALIVGFAGSGAAFVAATLNAEVPALTIALLMGGALFLVLLDMCAGLPFLMAVKPSERTEMSAVYATFRDVSGLVTPGVARIVLAFGPLVFVFAAAGVGLGLATLIAAKLHPRLGASRAAATRSAPAD
jgi:MFS family permease